MRPAPTKPKRQPGTDPRALDVDLSDGPGCLWPIAAVLITWSVCEMLIAVFGK